MSIDSYKIFFFLTKNLQLSDKKNDNRRKMKEAEIEKDKILANIL